MNIFEIFIQIHVNHMTSTDIKKNAKIVIIVFWYMSSSVVK